MSRDGRAGGHGDDGGVSGRPGLSPIRFVMVFGVVSGLSDFVYEGARSVVGPYLATLGASGAAVGLVTGIGEAVALVFRLFTGRLSDRTGRHWVIAVSGYVITAVSVPLLAVATAVWPAYGCVVGERLGKAVRTPARDTMLAEASTDLGRGRIFALHEALDQSGAFAGPLVVALVLATHGGYRVGFAWLAVPAVFALLTLAYLRRRVPDPSVYDAGEAGPQDRRFSLGEFSRSFWEYSAFTAATMAGFATFAVLSFHLEHRHLVPAPAVPVMYAMAMALAGLAALASGRLYDRVGLRGLVALPVLGGVVPFLSFSTSVLLVWVGAGLWGALMGVHESTMRAAVADLVPRERRGAGYGTFTAVYGLAWLVGAAVIGFLYDVSVHSVLVFTVAVQAVALLAFVPVWRIKVGRAG